MHKWFYPFNGKNYPELVTKRFNYINREFIALNQLKSFTQ